ncbi:MAG: hypothetical protein NDJ90_05500 [Oligoflexia bacterium]|nr:hypothetical protein [Oligoflexia bacterium]
MKYLVSVLILSALSFEAHAMGKKAAEDGEALVGNRKELFFEVLRKHNAAPAAEATFRKEEIQEGNEGSYCGKSYPDLAEFEKYLPQRKQEVCRDLTRLIPPGYSCEDLLQVKKTGSWTTCDCFTNPFSSYYENTSCDITAHLQLEVTPTAKALKLFEGSLFFDPGLKAIDYNVAALQNALENLKLLPRQKKALEGLWNAVTSLNLALKSEQQKSERGEKTKPVSHRDFAAQASLIVSYYRYLKDDLQELGQYASSSSGVDRGNKDAITVIDQAITNLIEAYGLESDAIAKQAADYGRVFVDLMNNLSQYLTQSEKQTYIRPLMIAIGGKVIPASEAYGDVAAREGVLEFEALWENPAFQQFLQDKLSATDERLNSLILNVSNLAYKIGLATNVDIRVLDARDIERLKITKPRG